jgi:hypothetical protein
MIDDFFGAGAGVFAHSLFQQCWYSGFCTAFRISDGLVVASRGCIGFDRLKITGVRDDDVCCLSCSS